MNIKNKIINAFFSVTIVLIILSGYFNSIKKYSVYNEIKMNDDKIIVSSSTSTLTNYCSAGNLTTSAGNYCEIDRFHLRISVVSPYSNINSKTENVKYAPVYTNDKQTHYIDIIGDDYFYDLEYYYFNTKFNADSASGLSTTNILENQKVKESIDNSEIEVLYFYGNSKASNDVYNYNEFLNNIGSLNYSHRWNEIINSKFYYNFANNGIVKFDIKEAGYNASVDESNYDVINDERLISDGKTCMRHMCIKSSDNRLFINKSYYEGSLKPKMQELIDALNRVDGVYNDVINGPNMYAMSNVSFRYSKYNDKTVADAVRDNKGLLAEFVKLQYNMTFDEMRRNGYVFLIEIVEPTMTVFNDGQTNHYLYVYATASDRNKYIETVPNLGKGSSDGRKNKIFINQNYSCNNLISALATNGGKGYNIGNNGSFSYRGTTGKRYQSTFKSLFSQLCFMDTSVRNDLITATSVGCLEENETYDYKIIRNGTEIKIQEPIVASKSNIFKKCGVYLIKDYNLSYTERDGTKKTGKVSTLINNSEVENYNFYISESDPKSYGHGVGIFDPNNFDMIFRIIDRTNPFPGASGNNNRKKGANWAGDNGNNLCGFDIVKSYITDANDSYNSKNLKPKYSIVLKPSDISAIRKYNNKVGNTYSNTSVSSFIENLEIGKVTYNTIELGNLSNKLVINLNYDIEKNRCDIFNEYDDGDSGIGGGEEAVTGLSIDVSYQSKTDGLDASGKPKYSIIATLIGVNKDNYVIDSYSCSKNNKTFGNEFLRGITDYGVYKCSSVVVSKTGTKVDIPFTKTVKVGQEVTRTLTISATGTRDSKIICFDQYCTNQLSCTSYETDSCTVKIPETNQIIEYTIKNRKSSGIQTSDIEELYGLLDSNEKKYNIGETITLKNSLYLTLHAKIKYSLTLNYLDTYDTIFCETSGRDDINYCEAPLTEKIKNTFNGKVFSIYRVSPTDNERWYEETESGKFKYSFYNTIPIYYYHNDNVNIVNSKDATPKKVTKTTDIESLAGKSKTIEIRLSSQSSSGKSTEYLFDDSYNQNYYCTIKSGEEKCKISKLKLNSLAINLIGTGQLSIIGVNENKNRQGTEHAFKFKNGKLYINDGFVFFESGKEIELERGSVNKKVYYVTFGSGTYKQIISTDGEIIYKHYIKKNGDMDDKNRLFMNENYKFTVADDSPADWNGVTTNWLRENNPYLYPFNMTFSKDKKISNSDYNYKPGPDGSTYASEYALKLSRAVLCGDELAGKIEKCPDSRTEIPGTEQIFEKDSARAAYYKKSDGSYTSLEFNFKLKSGINNYIDTSKIQLCPGIERNKNCINGNVSGTEITFKIDNFKPNSLVPIYLSFSGTKYIRDKSGNTITSCAFEKTKRCFAGVRNSQETKIYKIISNSAGYVGTGFGYNSFNNKYYDTNLFYFEMTAEPTGRWEDIRQ